MVSASRSGQRASDRLTLAVPVATQYCPASSNSPWLSVSGKVEGTTSGFKPKVSKISLRLGEAEASTMRLPARNGSASVVAYRKRGRTSQLVKEREVERGVEHGIGALAQGRFGC